MPIFISILVSNFSKKDTYRLKTSKKIKHILSKGNI